jgi:ribonuclease P protein component
LLLTKRADSKKFGFAVSQKIRGAVKRNKAKRLLKEVLRLNQDILPENRSLILVAKPGIEKTPFDILVHEFKTLVIGLGPKNDP